VIRSRPSFFMMMVLEQEAQSVGYGTLSILYNTSRRPYFSIAQCASATPTPACLGEERMWRKAIKAVT